MPGEGLVGLLLLRQHKFRVICSGGSEDAASALTCRDNGEVLVWTKDSYKVDGCWLLVVRYWIECYSSRNQEFLTRVDDPPPLGQHLPLDRAAV